MSVKKWVCRCARAACVAAVFAIGGAWAAENVREIPAQRTGAPPVIDGRPDDPCWAGAPTASDFTEHKTSRIAKEQTTARVLYDDTYLYVAFECIEPEPKKLQATERKRDRLLWDEDWVEVQFDTLGDQRGRYVFALNPLGTLFDARVDVFGWNNAWDSTASGASEIGADKWCAEFAIPIGELHFVRGKDVTWTINFHRGEKGAEEESTWCYSQDSPYAIRHGGRLTGLDLSGVAIKRLPSVESYVSGTLRTEGGESEAAAGLDLSMRLTPQVVTTLTLNPDFGQVEADTDTIELRDTERFLPERRPFFREGAEMFRTPINVYYSRRIWDIDAGIKMIEAGPQWDMGALDIEGTITQDGVQKDGNYFVGRLIRKLEGSSHVGAIAVNSQRSDGYNRLAGFDSSLRLTDRFEWISQALVMEDERTVSVDRGNGIEQESTRRQQSYAMETGFEWSRRPLEWELTLRDVSEGFQPDLGYVPRQDIRGMSSWFGIEKDIEEGPVKRVSGYQWFTFYENHEGDTTLRDSYEELALTFRNQIGLGLTREDAFHAPYKNRRTAAQISYNLIDFWQSIEAGYAWGEFEDVPYQEFTVTKPFKLGDRFTATVSGDYRLEYPESRDENGVFQEDRAVWLWRWVSEYTFPWNARVKFTYEETSEERHNLTLLFAWLPRKDIDFYIVATDIESGGIADQGIFAKTVYRF